MLLWCVPGIVFEVIGLAALVLRRTKSRLLNPIKARHLLLGGVGSASLGVLPGRVADQDGDQLRGWGHHLLCLLPAVAHVDHPAVDRIHIFPLPAS